MSVEKIICDYCKKEPPKKVDMYPTWFGRYTGSEKTLTICSICLPNNREKWKEGKI